MGGSGGSYKDWPTDRLSRAVREDNSTSAAEFEVGLAEYLSELLASFNDRNIDLVRERIEDAKELLQDSIDASLDDLFGGSVAKHTYVDGLSDIDSLLIVNGPKFEDLNPTAILNEMESVLRKGLGDKAKVEHGHMAVTLTYPDGMSVQLLPAIQLEGGLKVPSARHAGWSDINPDSFRVVLSKRNQECGGKLVPTIKLAKAIVASLPEQYRLTGYHVESIAIAAFSGYAGTKTTAMMLPHLFNCAKDLVLSPIRDRTGQSVHVDAYLGDANSSERQY